MHNVAEVIKRLEKVGFKVDKIKGDPNDTSAELYLTCGLKFDVRAYRNRDKIPTLLSDFIVFLKDNPGAGIEKISEDFYKESYNPICHDNRVYTLVNRTRKYTNIRRVRQGCYALEGEAYASKEKEVQAVQEEENTKRVCSGKSGL